MVSIASREEEEGELIEPALEFLYLLRLSFADVHTSPPLRSPARHTFLSGFGMERKGGAYYGSRAPRNVTGKCRTGTGLRQKHVKGSC